MTSNVIITGASQGIGKATARLFAQQGYDLVLAARNVEHLEVTANEIQQLGRRVLAVPTDVTELSQVQNLINKALNEYGNIDILINNAGICLTGRVECTKLEDWQQLMDTNFWGYLHTINCILPHFLERGQGIIVNVGSVGGKVPLPNMTAYCASKYAVTGLTDNLRLELKPKGIHVGAVHPSVTKSNFMTRAQFRGRDAAETENYRQAMSNLLETNTPSQPEEVAKAIWDVVQHRKNEVVVGSGTMLSTVYRLFPDLVEWLMSKAVK
ncbi:MAG TPA: SDR family oxidoreductase [Nostocaceae cyanobacterium]|nr:SDR family oxidoreductase [Nostocaceae cyanobacterium]